MTPDKIYFNGKVLTVDGGLSIQSAFSVRGDKFVAVGSDAAVLASAGPATECHDLQGQTVIPGLNEGHCHLQSASISELEQEICAPTTVSGVIAWVRQQTAVSPKGAWIVAPRLFAARLDELRFPNLAELDYVAPDHPVFLNGSFGGQLNSAALRSDLFAGNRPDGLVLDPATGRPTGLLRGTAFSRLLNPEYRTCAFSRKREAVRKLMLTYNRVGITSITDTIRQSSDLDVYRNLAEQEELTLRVFTNYSTGQPRLTQAMSDLAQMTQRTGDGDAWLRMGPYKVYLDGGVLTATACMLEPWTPRALQMVGETDPGYRGSINYSLDELSSVVRAANNAGWSFTAHTTGDGGLKLLLDAYAALHATQSINTKRFGAIHANLMSDEALRRCRKMGVLWDMQPAWFYLDADAMRVLLGEERFKRFHPCRSAIEAGVILCGGSDHMVKLDPREAINPYDPFLGMYTLFTHRTRRGTILNADEVISRMEALKAYTINNAFKSGEERLKGSIETGKLADFVVLDRDFLDSTPEEFLETKVLATIVGGNMVYGAVE